ncbi:MAG: hypothetical protein GX058_06125 [Firmicutes bacterium]|nr:hypothetical protein [Bacillota bacterium]
MTDKLLTRREFLLSSSSFMAGAAVGSALGGSLLTSAAEPEFHPLPWPYVKLDPERARKLGYELYFQGG